MIISLGYRDDREILKGVGKISAKLAKEHAEKEYEIFRIKQAQIPYNTDFEEFAGVHSLRCGSNTI